MTFARFFFFYIALLCSGLSLSACAAQESPRLPTEEAVILSAGRERGKLTLELALTPKQQEDGLMGRKKLKKHHGMIFIFPSNTIARFWMKDTLIPLDIIFIDQDGRIMKIHERAKPRDETFVSSDFQVRAAIELNAGAAKLYKLNVGDLILSPALDRVVAESGAVAE